MEVAMLEYDIKKIEQSDVQEVYRLLRNEVKEPKLSQNIKNHIRHGVAYKMIVDNKICAVALAKKFDTHYSLSYYLIAEETRRKMPSLFFFLCIVKKLSELPIYIKPNKNLAQYERYFEACESGVYRFKGLREDASWAELLKR